MTGPAITLMLVAIVIIWGGLAVSVTALVVRGRREDKEARAQAQSRHQRGILGQAKQAHHSKHPTTPEELRAQLQTQHLHPRGAWRR